MSKKLRRNRALIATAGLGVAALVLAGCSTPGDDNAPVDGGEVNEDATISIAETNDFTSFNPNTPAGNVDINSKVNYVTHETFAYVDNEFNIVPNEGFGTYEKTSDDPLTVEYTLNEGLEWSDGEPITTDDLLLGWAIASGYFDDAKTDPATGEIISGTQYFTIAGSTEGIRDTAVPEVSDDKLKLTLVYETPYVDWDLIWLLDQPAHVVAEKAGVSTDELIEAIKTTPKGDPEAPAEPNATILAAAQFWNTGFDVSALPDDESLYVSNGPFIVDAWAPTQSISFKKNENYKGTNEVKYSNLVIRFIGDSQAQVSALQNGEIDIINPQASQDTLVALEGLDGVETETGAQLSYDHVDISFRGDFTDPTVREAFLKTIPRQQLVDQLITPIDENASVLNSQVYVTSQTELYEKATSENGAEEAFAEVDIEGAKELLDGRTPTVRILYSSTNPNRVTTFEAIEANATEAGFVVESVGREDWGAQLGTDIYDVAIFGWISPGVGNISAAQIFAAGGGGNYNNYSNDEVTKLANGIMTETDPEAIEEAQVEIDKLLFEDFYGLPLWQSPGLIAYNSSLGGVKFMANQTGPIWNFWEWTSSK